MGRQGVESLINNILPFHEDKLLAELLIIKYQINFESLLKPGPDKQNLEKWLDKTKFNYLYYFG